VKPIKPHIYVFLYTRYIKINEPIYNYYITKTRINKYVLRNFLNLQKKCEKIIVKKDFFAK